MYEEPDNPDMVDLSGYLGLFYREKRQLTPISEAELIDLVIRKNRLPQIMRVIREIDRDNNGYVTNQELDDIFKINYEEELGSRDLKTVFKRFASLQNRILIDYKKLRDHLMARATETRALSQFLSEGQQPSPQRQGSVLGSRLSQSILAPLETKGPVIQEDLRSKVQSVLSKSMAVEGLQRLKTQSQLAVIQDEPKRKQSPLAQMGMGLTKTRFMDILPIASHVYRLQRLQELVKSKLSYEWSLILRVLKQQD